jgi:hypothetical protein
VSADSRIRDVTVQTHVWLRRVPLVALSAALAWLPPAPVYASSIVLDPSTQSAPPGQNISIDLRIEGLHDATAPSLGIFDVDLFFDAAYLQLVDVAFGDQLDLFGLGDIRAATPGIGIVNLFELSLDTAADLDSLQAGDFILASLIFTTLSPGQAALTLRVNALGAADGTELAPSVGSALVTVGSSVPSPPAVPEPGTLVLLGTALALGRTMRKRFLLILGVLLLPTAAAHAQVPLNVDFFNPASRIEGTLTYLRTSVTPDGQAVTQGMAQVVKPENVVMFVPGAWQDKQSDSIVGTFPSCSYRGSSASSGTTRAGVSAPFGSPPTYVYFGVRFDRVEIHDTCGPSFFLTIIDNALIAVYQDPLLPDRIFGHSEVVDQSGGNVTTTTIHVELSLVCDTCRDHPMTVSPSEFEPPKPTDTTFVTPRLSTGCTFRGDGPIIVTLDVTRVAGAIDAEGYLLAPAALVERGVVGATATLVLPAFDVDAEYRGFWSPEADSVMFNGRIIRRAGGGQDSFGLTGQNNTWVVNTFEVPIEYIRFPDQAEARGQSPAPRTNTISIAVDQGNINEDPYFSREIWCTAIDWAALTIKATSPTILVHGNNSSADFWDHHGFAAALRAEGLPVDGCSMCRHPLTLPTDFVAENAARLDQRIPEIVKTFGVDSYHLVAHSKGGLDSRKYLEYPGHDIQLLSLTTLSTPHDGSVLADISVARGISLNFARKVKFVGFPSFTGPLVSLLNALGPDNGARNLTTAFTRHFNATNVDRLPDADYNQIAADGDRNGSGTIDTEAEIAALRLDNSKLRIMPTGIATEFVVNPMYQNLRLVKGLSTSTTQELSLVLTPTGPRFQLTDVLHVIAEPLASALGNDVLVTIPSGLGFGGIKRRSTGSFVFSGVFGRNHSDIANHGVAPVVAPWVLNAERTRGDLR